MQPELDLNFVGERGRGGVYQAKVVHLYPFKHLFLFQKRPDPIHVLSVLQRLFKTLCE